jgi:hypothetical protein
MTAKIFILFFYIWAWKTAGLHTDFKSLKELKEINPKKLFAKFVENQLYKWESSHFTYTLMVNNFLMSNSSAFFSQFRNQHNIVSFSIPKVKFCQDKV